MKKIFSLLFLTCGFGATIFSAELTAKPVAQENRFLFIVEDSAAMARSAKAAQQTVRELIESGVQGEMHPGDMFSLWTFNAKLDATFPVKHWSSGESKNLAQATVDFLKKRKYDQKAELRAALSPAYSLIKSSQSITVILISTGTEAIRGTPFDKEINIIYPQYSRELREAKIPFVTVLIGFNGRPVAYSVNSSIGPIQIPQPPLKREIAPTATNVVDAATHTKPVPETNHVAAPAIAKVETKLESKKVEVAPALPTNISTPITAPKLTFSAPPENNNPVAPLSTQVEPLKTAVENPAASPAESPQKTEVKPVIAPPAPTVAAVESPSPIVKSTEPPSPVRESKPESAATERKEAALPPTAPTPVVASQSIFSPGILLIAGAALLLVAGILIFFLARHSGKSTPSLISHSIDQKK